METRQLGNSGISVSVLGFGADKIGDASIGEEQAARLLHGVLDAGVTVIDTARSYGMSEERIGRHLRQRRNEFVLSTKIGYGIPGFQDWTGPGITAGIDFALKLLQTDRIDIVHLHSCPQETLQQMEVVEALLRGFDAGKIRAAAYSGDNEPFDWALQSGKFHSLQTSLNICDQHSAEGTAVAAKKGIGIIAKRPLANAPWRFVTKPDADEATEVYWERWRAMNLSSVWTDPSEFALRFVASLPGVSSCIVGTRSLDHLSRNVKNIEKGPLPAEDVSMIRSVFQRNSHGWRGQI